MFVRKGVGPEHNPAAIRLEHNFIPLIQFLGSPEKEAQATGTCFEAKAARNQAARREWPAYRTGKARW